MDFTVAALMIAGFGAGFIDAVAGGGGLVQLPALLAMYPTQPLPTLFGTNKLASIWGTLAAAAQYTRRVRLPWVTVAVALLSALICAWFGARAVSVLPATGLRQLVLVLLVLVALYTFTRRDLGLHHRPCWSGAAEAASAALIGAGLGFYDGIFGPGTGAFLVFFFVRGLGYDFLHASAAAKIVNVATNFAALAFFIPHGQVLWLQASLLAASNLLGSLLGAHYALRHGSEFVRRVFLGVVMLLILKLAHDTWWP
ncbi:MAG: TSUP family transporter [Gammaproteobacteria bacterium]|nr:TSUP family transporter [Gammaproteobacteria bacterium]